MKKLQTKKDADSTESAVENQKPIKKEKITEQLNIP
jgi:hypothetical protein